MKYTLKIKNKIIFSKKKKKKKINKVQAKILFTMKFSIQFGSFDKHKCTFHLSHKNEIGQNMNCLLCSNYL